MAKKSKNPEPTSEERENQRERWKYLGGILMQIIPVVISFWAIIQTSQSLDMQRKQYEEEKSEDAEKEKAEASEKVLRDSAEAQRNREISALTKEQIAALKKQAAALQDGVRNTEFSQRPVIDIEQLGLHIVGSDSAVLYFKVKNFGVRPSYLKTVTVYLFDGKFELLGGMPKPVNANMSLTTGQEYQYTVENDFGRGHCSVCDLDDFLRLGDFHLYIVMKYIDPFLSEHAVRSKSVIHKWTYRPKSKLVKYMEKNNAQSLLYPLDLCTAEEEAMVINAMKRIKSAD